MNEYKEFTYKKSSDGNSWTIIYPGGFRLKKKFTVCPDEASVESLIDEIIEFVVHS